MTCVAATHGRDALLRYTCSEACWSLGTAAARRAGIEYEDGGVFLDSGARHRSTGRGGGIRGHNRRCETGAGPAWAGVEVLARLDINFGLATR